MHPYLVALLSGSLLTVGILIARHVRIPSSAAACVLFCAAGFVFGPFLWF